MPLSCCALIVTANSWQHSRNASIIILEHLSSAPIVVKTKTYNCLFYYQIKQQTSLRSSFPTWSEEILRAHRSQACAGWHPRPHGPASEPSLHDFSGSPERGVCNLQISQVLISDFKITKSNDNTLLPFKNFQWYVSLRSYLVVVV